MVGQRKQFECVSLGLGDPDGDFLLLFSDIRLINNVNNPQLLSYTGFSVWSLYFQVCGGYFTVQKKDKWIKDKG